MTCGGAGREHALAFGSRLSVMRGETRLTFLMISREPSDERTRLAAIPARRESA